MKNTIDLETDTLLPVAPLVEGRVGRRISPATLWRWRVKGIHGVRLEAYLVAGVWCSTPAALTAFLRDSSAAAMSGAPKTDGRPRERDPETTRRLQAAGLLPDGARSHAD